MSYFVCYNSCDCCEGPYVFFDANNRIRTADAVASDRTSPRQPCNFVSLYLISLQKFSSKVCTINIVDKYVLNTCLCIGKLFRQVVSTRLMILNIFWKVFEKRSGSPDISFRGNIVFYVSCMLQLVIYNKRHLLEFFIDSNLFKSIHI